MARMRNLTIGLQRVLVVLAAACWAAAGCPGQSTAIGDDSKSAAKNALQNIGVSKGVCMVLGLPDAEEPGFVTELAAGSELIFYFQSPAAEEVAAVRRTAEQAGLLGRRVFVDQGDCKSIHLADNMAAAVLVSPAVGKDDIDTTALLRVLHPEGKLLLGDRQLVKEFPENTDDWSHPYHGADNNPQSRDQLARSPYLTQFLAGPMFCPMPEITVASSGRIFKAFGHIAHKANQNAVLNTLLCINGYNGTVLWRRELPEGFMVHRNTMVATPDLFYMADAESCKVFDARTGKIKDEIVLPEGLADGPVWKWMAIEDGVLYALVGGEEIKVAVQPSSVPGMGHWPWGMWEGHDYRDQKTNFGFGRAIVAIELGNKKILWTHRDDEFIDSRGTCMATGRIYFYSPEQSLGCLDAKTGKVAWKTSAPDLLAAIGPNGRAQHYVTGYSTTTYIKCNDEMLLFAGPQRSRLVAAATADGKLLWQKPNGNSQLVLRDDGIYAAGPGATGCKMAYATGNVLAQLPARRACTRATGSVDSIFYRTTGGTVRVDVASNTAHHIAPIRPPCQDGVIISDGLLYWGPWMCGCQLSLYGHVCLAPAREFNFRPEVDDSRLQTASAAVASDNAVEVRPGDWPCYRGNNRRTAVAHVAIPRSGVKRQWIFNPPAPCRATAPVTAGRLVFFGDDSGVVRALDADGKLRWKAHTGGAVFCSPAVAKGRVFVGSADGRVYAFDAATGQRLWCFRAAPAERWIPVYGKLISTWPVSGGVVVHGGVVYAAAGIAHYDGTYVYALDAATGKPRWCNDTSGTVSAQFNSGVSLQGNLYIRGGELCFSAGNVHDTARYDLATGKCLNQPNQSVRSNFRTAFYAYYPRYGQYVSLNHTLADGRSLNYQASYDGAKHTRLALLAPVAPGAKPQRQTDRRQGPMRRTLWQEPSGRAFNSFIVSGDVLLAAGTAGPYSSKGAFLAAVDVKDGSDIWRQELPAAVVKGGTAVDHDGRLFVSLENGQVLCLSGN